MMSYSYDCEAGAARRRTFGLRLVPGGAGLLGLLLLGATPTYASPVKAAHGHKGHAMHTAVTQPGAGEVDASPIVARMGDVALHAHAVEKLVAGLSPADRAALAKDPKILTRVLAGALANRFLLNEALGKHWEEQPAVAAALERLRDNAIIQSYLASVAAAPTDFPTEADIETAYEVNKSALVAPVQYDVAQIFVASKDGADQETESKAREKILSLARQLRQAGANFAAIARANSEAKTTAARGGEIGWLSEAQLRPEIKAHVLGLKKGGVSEPIRLDDGWQILKLLDVKPAGTVTLDQVREALKQRLRQQRASELQRAYIGALIKANPISIDADALKNIGGASGEATR
jgi:hypothetical protein